MGSAICLSAGVKAEDVVGASSGLTEASGSKKERIASCSINQLGYFVSDRTSTKFARFKFD